MPTTTDLLPALRTWAAIDAENLDRAAVRSGLTPGLGSAWRHLVPTHPRLTTMAAADASRYSALRREFVGERLAVGIGQHGAERALIRHISDHVLHAGYECLVIGSGDHEFVDVAWRARHAGMTVVVIAPDDSLSTSLARIAHHTIPFVQRSIPSNALGLAA